MTDDMASAIDIPDPKNDYQLSEMLNLRTVEARVSVQDWEEAAERIGSLLVNSGCINESYVIAMKRVLIEMGPYAVIAPGIALLHARPEDGVIKPCLGLVTLSNPVNFGHSENDPVDLVFGLGALDKKAHIHALQQLATFLADEKALRELRLAQDTQTIINIVKTWSKLTPV